MESMSTAKSKISETYRLQNHRETVSFVAVEKFLFAMGSTVIGSAMDQPSTPSTSNGLTDSPVSSRRESLRTPAGGGLSGHQLPQSAPAALERGPLRSRTRQTHPVFISFYGEKEDVNALVRSQSYDFSSTETYFDQCFPSQTQIGGGSFATVFSAKANGEDIYYAVKHFKKPYKNKTDRSIKLGEVEKLQFVGDHPNLVHFVRAWEEKDHLYIQTELCEKSLDQIMSQDHKIPEDTLWKYFHDLLQAVHYIHSLNLIHVDIKPENIFVTRSGVCQLGDFGLMRDITKEDKFQADEGDKRYLDAKVLNEKPGKPSDIFSLGITILEIASGRRLPGEGPDWHDLRENTIHTSFFNGLSDELSSIIKSMMDPEPSARPTAEMLLNHHRFTHMQKAQITHSRPSPSNNIESYVVEPVLRQRPNAFSPPSDDSNNNSSMRSIMKSPTARAVDSDSSDDIRTSRMPATVSACGRPSRLTNKKVSKLNFE
uniref:Membrane-associated tyrosine- and threonine-specific cdc2-inhibitory kinase wee-1.3 n=1 Tax=Steinernema glaseri TaxID=37863 RepID=A0A1I7Z0T4_9BILA